MKRLMELPKKVQKTVGAASMYALWKQTRDRGVDVSINGISSYYKTPITSMRLDVLVTWQEMAAEKGVDLATFWGWLKKDLKENK